MWKRWLVKFLTNLQVPRLETDLDKITISLSGYWTKKQVVKTNGTLIFYSKPGCLLCQEVKAWLDYYWVPYIEVKCSLAIPQTFPKFKHLMNRVLFNCKTGKEKIKLYLIPAFPQIEFAKPIVPGPIGSHHYDWQSMAGDGRQIRAAVEKFIKENPNDFPGFDKGVYGDVSPSETVGHTQPGATNA